MRAMTAALRAGACCFKTGACALRIEAARLFDAALVEAFAALDTPAGGPPILCDDQILAQQRGHDRFLLKARWVP